MTEQDPEPTPNSPVRQFMFGSEVFSVALSIGVVNGLLIIGGALLGAWLDRMFGTKPLFVLALILIPAPLGLFLTFKLAQNAALRVGAVYQTKTKKTHPTAEESPSERS